MDDKAADSELMAMIATLYALVLEIDQAAKVALNDGSIWELDAAMVKIRELIKPIREDKKHG